MNDLEKLTAMFDAWGVEYEEEQLGEGHTMIKTYGTEGGGSPSFWTEFLFDAAGNFKEMGTWE